MTIEEKVEISKLIFAYAIKNHPNIFATCSFGKDSRVIVDLAMQIKPDLQFIGIDTGYEFPETVAFAEQLVKETGMNFRWVKPKAEEIQQINQEYGSSFIKNGKYKCCQMKIPVIKALINQYGAWITGLRRDETKFRKNIKLIEQKEIIKINPIAFWTQDDVWQYIREKRLNYHPLYDQGYASLGCQPCTIKIKTESSKNLIFKKERAGRFVGVDNQGEECGLHLDK